MRLLQEYTPPPPLNTPGDNVSLSASSLSSLQGYSQWFIPHVVWSLRLSTVLPGGHRGNTQDSALKKDKGL
ncbi:hypothetical protein J6590_020400 [Homalodisca vitripennis]|nr:hypothetical protein J6590_020400 [Homalodisca vitripennis]